MRRNEMLNKKVVKALAVGATAVMLMQPVGAIADDTDIPSVSQNEDGTDVTVAQNDDQATATESTEVTNIKAADKELEAKVDYDEELSSQEKYKELITKIDEYNEAIKDAKDDTDKIVAEVAVKEEAEKEFADAQGKVDGLVDAANDSIDNIHSQIDGATTKESVDSLVEEADRIKEDTEAILKGEEPSKKTEENDNLAAALEELNKASEKVNGTEDKSGTAENFNADVKEAKESIEAAQKNEESLDKLFASLVPDAELVKTVSDLKEAVDTGRGDEEATYKVCDFKAGVGLYERDYIGTKESQLVYILFTGYYLPYVINREAGWITVNQYGTKDSNVTHFTSTYFNPKDQAVFADVIKEVTADGKITYKMKQTNIINGEGEVPGENTAVKYVNPENNSSIDELFAASDLRDDYEATKVSVKTAGEKLENIKAETVNVTLKSVASTDQLKSDAETKKNQLDVVPVTPTPTPNPTPVTPEPTPVQPTPAPAPAVVTIAATPTPLAATPVVAPVVEEVAEAPVEEVVAEAPAAEEVAEAPVESTEIAEEPTALASEPEVEIGDEATPLATLEEKQKMSWWWLLIVLVLGTTGAELFRRHQLKKKEAAKKED